MKKILALIAMVASLLYLQPAGATTPQVPDANALMDWAQATYPTLFPGTPATGTLLGFQYRYYAATQTFLGVNSGGDVDVLGPLSGNMLLRVGSLSDFSCLVYPASCASTGSGPTLAQRQAAAQATAQSASNDCQPVRPFYWEVGDGNGALASGSVSGGGLINYTANSQLAIASASKWLYAADVAQHRVGQMTAQDIQFLNFRSGYVGLSVSDSCDRNQTVDQCLATGTHGDYTAADVNKFYYAGGHMQKHASLMGFGAMDNAALATEVRSQIGSDIALSYVQPQPAGGVAMTPAAYAQFLRKLLNKQLQLAGLLGSNPVCTNPLTCSAAVYAPVPPTESWHYSLGHWVEDDPKVGDGAFSSPGAFGFYPWIDASKTYYGVVAREVASGYIESAHCGRLIRKAWLTGNSQ
jgi:hypothetical protein